MHAKVIYRLQDLAGRNLIRKRLSELPITMTWMEVVAGHAFIRDELSKGVIKPSHR
jgi:hypothetical protein